MTKADLKEYKALRMERDRLAELIQGLESALYGPKLPTLDGMPRSNPVEGSRLEKLVHKHIHLQQLYQKKVAELDKRMAYIEECIEPLEPTERTLIRLHYFQGMPWEEVAVKMNYSWRHVHRIHSRIIQKLQERKPLNCPNESEVEP